MSDTLPEREDQMDQHQVNKSGTCVIPGCPCRGWSAQETAGVKEVVECQSDHPWNNCPKCGIGICGEHMTAWLNHQPHQPAARGGGDEWQRRNSEVFIHRQMTPDELVKYRAQGFKTTDISYTIARFYGDDGEKNAQRTIDAVNQHQSLMAERERLREAIEVAIHNLNAGNDPKFLADYLRLALDPE